MKMSVFVLSLCLLTLIGAGPVGAQEPPTGSESASLRERSEALIEELQQLESELGELSEKIIAAEGEERLLLETQMRRRGRKILEDLDPLTANIVRLREQGNDTSEIRAAVEGLLTTAMQFIKNEIERLDTEESELVQSKAEVEPDDALELEQKRTAVSNEFDNLFNAFAELCAYKEKVEIDTGSDFTYLDEHLLGRANALAGEVELEKRRASELEEALARAPEGETPTFTADLAASRESLHRASNGLSATVNLMDERALDTAELKQILITATGQITSDIFDIEVVGGLLNSWWDAAIDWFVANAPQFLFKVLLFLLILFAFKLLARIASRIVKRTLTHTDVKLPVLVKDMALSFTSKAIVMLGLFIALSQLGLEIGPLLAGVGVAGFIVGFALQETLSNFAAGLMILIYQPFDVGDSVEAGGVSGKVDQMNLVSTTILTFDNQKLIVPNNKIWGDVIRNRTSETTRRVDMVFGISYADDIDRAEQVLRELVESHELVLADPAPNIRLNNLGDSSVDFIVRPWTKTEDYWTVFWDITREVKKRFDAQGIRIPFPQRDVHVYKEAVSVASPNGQTELQQGGSSQNVPDMDSHDAEDAPQN